LTRAREVREVTLDVRPPRQKDDGWLVEVRVTDGDHTTHQVHVSRAAHERYGGGDVADLVRRTFEFLLAREPNTSILREFSLATVEGYFPEFRAAIRAS
jgi:hypothetical protein